MEQQSRNMQRKQTRGYQGGGQDRVGDSQGQSAVCEMDKQQGYTVQQKKPYSLFSNNFQIEHNL